jgi:segregation and condensation protein B
VTRSGPPSSAAAQAASWTPPWARSRTATGDTAEEAEALGSGLPDEDETAEGWAGHGPLRGLRTVTGRSGTARLGPVEGLDSDTALAAALEAILLVTTEPVTELHLAQVLQQPAGRVAATLERVANGYTDRGYGIDLRRAAGGWRLYTRAEYADYVERFQGTAARRTPLTAAGLETLAVIAYKQPSTRARISAIRGVNCDGVMKTLTAGGWIEVCGTDPDTGGFLYRTTVMFLERLGLADVSDLPPLAPFMPGDVGEVLDGD